MKKFFRSLVVLSTASCALVYFFTCFTPYISPGRFWPASFLALGYPFVTVGMVSLIFYWFFIQKKVSLLLLAILVLGYQNFFSTIAIHCFSTPVARPANTIRILTWNVRGFDNPSTYIDTPGSVRQQMFDYIRDSAPDIICMQEFTEHRGKGMISNSTELLDMGYNYYFRTDDMARQYPYGYIATGTAIFSRIPIVSTGKMMFPDTSFPEHIAYVDVVMHNSPLRIFSTHFKSLNLGAILADPNNKALFYGDSNFIYTASKFEKLKVFPQEHALEGNLAKALMNKSPYPVIFCGDLNSVPASYPYHVMSQGLQDAFLQKGFGLGTTMDSLPQTLRIDYLLVDKKIAIKNYVRNELHLSDHFPQMIDVQWKDEWQH